MLNARFTLAKSLQKARWRWKTHIEAQLYAMGQRSTHWIKGVLGTYVDLTMMLGLTVKFLLKASIDNISS